DYYCYSTDSITNHGLF
nr:immunoglobulin light chain junction region [Macaca mulatta]MOW57584.1 immunoglobulin light chain junction region [Macaca mulatta]MOW57944.1 immunoglobulin light chain junction region [Macaca mulatta]MOW58522.1 immunoglobulin light chain junction region [Macaca mulatta]MOW58720.1 immunoglobulin light chain junction region [Macaca mulatta]